MYNQYVIICTCTIYETIKHYVIITIVSVQKWMLSHQLKMNDDKTEFLVISSKSIARGIVSPSLHIGDHQVVATSTARNIGVMMDSKASMEAHVLSVCKSSFIHIRNLSRIKKFVDSSSLECLVHACITTKLDYCNSLLCGAPSALINKLQRIQNIVAMIITGHGRCEHITPVLKSYTGCRSNKGSSLRLLAWCRPIKPPTTWHRYTYKNYSIHMCHVDDYGPVKRTY